MLLAWACLSARPQARRYLDLGSGKGTVALLLLSRLLECTAVGVEAFEQSHALAVRNAALNALTDRYTPVLCDLRHFETKERFGLIGGAPPFMPLGTGVLPKDPQRAAGRFEVRGGVEAFAETGARLLAPDGALVLLMDGLNLARTQRAISRVGLYVTREVEVAPRPGAAPTYYILQGEAAPRDCVTSRLEMRGTGEDWSPAYAEIRHQLDL